MGRKAFTLIELLVVIAIIAILAAILFPVFAQAKAAAKKAAAISNFNQLSKANDLYFDDNDDKYPIMTYNATFSANPVNPDSTIQQITRPLWKSEDVLLDPMNPIQKRERETAGGDLPLPNTTWRENQRQLNLAFTSDFGFNTQFLNPIGYNPSQPFNGGVKPYAATQTQIGDPARTIGAVSSIWGRRTGGGPYGGGNYGVDPPCVREAVTLRELRPFVSADPSYYWFGGWNPSQPNAWNVFGGVWPWHTNKIVIIAWADGHTKTMSLSQIAKGCDVRDGWAGTVLNMADYIWDLE